MKIIINSLIFTVFTLNCVAQEGNIQINQDSKIEKLLEIYKSIDESSDVYQIQIYNGSLSGANHKKSNLDSDFPKWKTKIVHVDTDYRVRIDGIKTALEAERKYNEVRKKYPAAMIITPN
ncbi:SPOR domain-containing protein [Cellulophaga sp. HaHaR_3_176]|uniref:SPOR domain-containing protein n=1 Tax=Cellulophaga sp. HaHaR_3_176 TaxID=1942464 RepID=UPI001C20103F|nr:SPOR domain-containing protein [Cellulophaga sp. HaHaR_3_176]QWX84052.1 SPOR domain-containing protein [Cellulophaga sp. HaHaR_3_176]